MTGSKVKLTNQQLEDKWTKLSVILCISSAVIFFVLEYFAFKGILQFHFWYAFIIIPLYRAMFNWKKNQEEREEKGFFKYLDIYAGAFTIVAILALFVAILIKSTYSFDFYTMFWFLISVALFGFIPPITKKIQARGKTGTSYVISIFFIVLFIIQGSLLLILQPTNVIQAHMIVEKAGYTDVKYETKASNERILTESMGGYTAPTLEKALSGESGYYIFYGKNDNNEEYYIAINVTNGEVSRERLAEDITLPGRWKEKT